MELYKYYFILFVLDMNDNISFISNTDPITYSPNIGDAKLYDDIVNVDNDILLYYERMRDLISNNTIKSFYRGYIKSDTQNTKEILFYKKIV